MYRVVWCVEDAAYGGFGTDGGCCENYRGTCLSIVPNRSSDGGGIMFGSTSYYQGRYHQDNITSPPTR